MKLASWRKAGRICKAKQHKKAHATYTAGNECPMAKQLAQTGQRDPSCARDHVEQVGGAAEAHSSPLQKPQSVLKKLVTFPLKALFSRSGAEIHDSAGLDQAVAYYVSATLDGQDSLWRPGGYPGLASHM